MKKVFALIAIVGFVACNNAEVKDATADSTAKAAAEKATADSIAALSPKTDTTATKVDTTATAAPTTPVEAPKH